MLEEPRHAPVKHRAYVLEGVIGLGWLLDCFNGYAHIVVGDAVEHLGPGKMAGERTRDLLVATWTHPLLFGRQKGCPGIWKGHRGDLALPLTFEPVALCARLRERYGAEYPYGRP